ncbi:MAG: GAF domain-containing protein [candidate division Zixibacteria bacterium]|nr:GAF domain-containing protein [candidate division Zixibacteria bacterium]
MSQYPQEERKGDSVRLLKDTIEAKINELTENLSRLKAKLSGVRSISNLSRKLYSVTSLDSILENVLLICLDQFKAKGALIKVQSGLKDMPISISKNRGMELENNQEFSPDSDLAIYLKNKNMPVFIDQVESELQLKSKFPGFQRGIKPVIFTPLVTGDNLRGVLILSGKTSEMSYTEEDLELLSLLANQAAVAVEISLLNQQSKKSSAELKKTRELLTQIGKSPDEDEILVTIAREVNNPLGIIKNYVTLLEQSLKKNDKSTSYLKVINEEADRIAGVIKRFMDFRKPGSEAKTLTDVGFLLEDTLIYVESQFSRDKVCIKKDLLKNLPKLKAFPEELKEVFLNILTTCKQSMPYGGEIEVSVRREKNRLAIEFKDTGSLLNGKDLSGDMLDLFHTSDGNALEAGLWISNSIMQRHNGELKVKNREDGKGTSYHINLPLIT